MKYYWTERPEMLFDSEQEAFDFFCDEPVNLLNGDDGYIASTEEE